MKSISRPRLVQVAQEAELAGRVPQRHQVLEEGHLHGRVVDQHAAVPAERGLPLQERPRSRAAAPARALRSCTAIARARLDGPKPIPDEVVDRRSVVLEQLWHRSPIVHVETGSTFRLRHRWWS